MSKQIFEILKIVKNSHLKHSRNFIFCNFDTIFSNSLFIRNIKNSYCSLCSTLRDLLKTVEFMLNLQKDITFIITEKNSRKIGFRKYLYISRNFHQV